MLDLLNLPGKRLQVDLDAEGRINSELWCGQPPHAGQPLGHRGGKREGPLEPADYALSLSRGGFSIKSHLTTDCNGIPLAALLSPGQHHEVPVFPALLDSVSVLRAKGRPRAGRTGWPETKSYDYELVYT